MIYTNEIGVEIILNPKNIFALECEPFSLTITAIPIGADNSEIRLRFADQNEYETFKNQLLKEMLRY